MTFVGSLRLTMSSPLITSSGGRVPRGTGMMSTSQGLLLKAHGDALYVVERLLVEEERATCARHAKCKSAK